MGGNVQMKFPKPCDLRFFSVKGEPLAEVRKVSDE